MFIDNIPNKDKRSMQRHRPVVCPFPKSCLPVSYHLGANKAGCCSGLIYKSNNLDCIRQCLFYETETHTVAHTKHFMTPTEALDQIHSLTLAVRQSLDYNLNYNSHYDQLCNDRNNGNMHPAEL